MHVSAVLLAAGASRRFGSPKLLAEVAGEPLVRRTARVLLEGGADSVVVVLGAKREEVGGALAGLDVHLFVNEAWEDGMLGSVQAGLRFAPPEAERLAVTPADFPGLASTDIRRVLDSSRRTAPATLAVATHEGRRGHPVVFSRFVANRV